MTAESVYCLVRCADGSFLLLNRRYKPFGQHRIDWVDYDTCSGIRVRLSERQLQGLARGIRPFQSGDYRVWLYDDRTRPEKDKACRIAYLIRFAVLEYHLQMGRAA